MCILVQIQYAAADALVAIKIFTKLVHDRLASGLGSQYTERDIRQKSLSLCQGIVDVNFSIKAAGGRKVGIWELKFFPVDLKV